MRNSSMNKDENLRALQDKYEEIIKGKDNQIAELEQRLLESQTQVSFSSLLITF